MWWGRDARMPLGLSGGRLGLGRNCVSMCVAGVLHWTPILPAARVCLGAAQAKSVSVTPSHRGNQGANHHSSLSNHGPLGPSLGLNTLPFHACLTSQLGDRVLAGALRSSILSLRPSAATSRRRSGRGFLVAGSFLFKGWFEGKSEGNSPIFWGSPCFDIEW